MSNRTLLSIHDLVVDYGTRLGRVRAVRGVDLDIQRGEILGLVGESGCGKSTLGKAILRMPPGRIARGSVTFHGSDLTQLSEREMAREIRGDRIGMVFQDPMTSLNPIQSIADHLTETIRTHKPEVSEGQARTDAEDLVDRLGIRSGRIDEYPHQFSGGMRQRIMIALALALHADLVIADEPTTALDVIVEAQFLDLLRELRDEFDLTIMLITHNIGVVAQIADRVAVMYAGKIVEIAPVEELFGDTKHPYSQGLLKAVPSIELEETGLYKMGGAPPSLSNVPSGCSFHPRCPHVMPICSEKTPKLLSVEGNDDHVAACWLYQGRMAGALAKK